jgi:hypothetical protein
MPISTYCWRRGRDVPVLSDDEWILMHQRVAEHIKQLRAAVPEGEDRSNIHSLQPTSCVKVDQ